MTNIVLRDDNTSENSASVSAPVIRMKDKPLVSVVIPSYNRAALLPEAIETVLQQTYQHFEIIVVDDESTDNTAEIAKQYPIRYIFQKNQGVFGRLATRAFWRAKVNILRCSIPTTAFSRALSRAACPCFRAIRNA